MVLDAAWTRGSTLAAHSSWLGQNLANGPSIQNDQTAQRHYFPQGTCLERSCQAILRHAHVLGCHAFRHGSGTAIGNDGPCASRVADRQLYRSSSPMPSTPPTKNALVQRGLAHALVQGCLARRPRTLSIWGQGLYERGRSRCVERSGIWSLTVLGTYESAPREIRSLHPGAYTTSRRPRDARWGHLSSHPCGYARNTRR